MAIRAPDGANNGNLVRLDRAGHSLEHIKGAKESLPAMNYSTKLTKKNTSWNFWKSLKSKVINYTL